MLESKILLRESMKKILLALLFCCSTVLANEEHKIRIVVPFASGGPASTLAHILQKSLSEELKTPVVIEYKPGASGAIGTAYGISYRGSDTVLILNTAASILNTFKNPQPYSEQQLVPVAYLGKIPLILVRGRKFELTTVQQLKTNDINRPIMYGTAGMGSAVHLATEKLNLHLNRSMVHVPYSGTAPYLIDTISGRLDMSFVFASSSIQAHIKNGELYAIAVENHTRLEALPEVPTFQESGIPDVGNFSWFVVFGGGGSQNFAPVQQAIRRILTNSQTSQPYKDFGLTWNAKEIIPPLDFVEQQRKSVAGLIKKVVLN